MVMFNSYVKLPEGISLYSIIITKAIMKDIISTGFGGFFRALQGLKKKNITGLQVTQAAPAA